MSAAFLAPSCPRQARASTSWEHEASSRHGRDKPGHDDYLTDAAYSSGLNPTSNLPPPSSSTGRLIIDGCASISAMAFFSVRPSLSLSGSLRKVVPARLSSVSQPAFLAQPSSLARSMPAVL